MLQTVASSKYKTIGPALQGQIYLGGGTAIAFVSTKTTAREIKQRAFRQTDLTSLSYKRTDEEPT